MRDVNLSGIIITHSQDVLNAIQDVQSAYRGYIITNDSSFLKSFDIANRFLQARISSLKSMPMTYTQRNLLDSISSLALEQKQFAFSIIVKRRYVSFLEAWNFLNSREENRLVNKLRYSVLKFTNAEKNLQSAKLKRENDNFNKVIYVVVISVIAAVLIILLTLIYIRIIYQRLVNTEQLLLKSQLRLESILDKLPVGVIIVNTKSNEYHANNKAVVLLNEQLLPDGNVFESHDKINTLEGVLKPELRDKLFISHAIHGEENIGFNETTINVDDREVPFRVSAIPVYNEKEQLEYAISVFDDISNIKQFENELIEAKKLVEESLRLKQSFLSNMSHEIRTPINAILGFAELLGKRDIGSEENEYVRIIRSAGENLLRLLNDILDFSKLESNMMVFEEHPVSIDGILNSICNLYLPKARNKGITLNYECDANVPEVIVGDPVRLTQVITNIVGNAIKFTPKGSVLIFAKLISTTDTQSIIEFKIKDSGIGISKDKLSRVFKRFEQAGSETTRLYGGTGLGLSIAKHIVQSQGGAISVTSELGVGSIFSFTMPFAKYDSENSVNKKPVESVTDLSFLEDLRILLVEDNTLNIKLINGIFLGTNVKVDVAETGGQAVEKVKDSFYDIILMDIELPDMNGYETTRIIRKDLKIQLPIIALTAHVLAGEKERCLEAGMNDYLTKPVNTRQLFEKINALITREFGLKQLAEEKLAVNTLPSQKLFSTENTVVDLSYLRELSDNNKEFEKEVIELFLSQVPSQMQELEEAIDHRNYSEIKMLAHKLKSSTAVTIGKNLLLTLNCLKKKRSITNCLIVHCVAIASYKTYWQKGLFNWKIYSRPLTDFH
ncbi:response regulator [Niabella ginsengisoli]|uniref:histidine kinase n=1 Tax=Niabella ginsengisoli TaxID=522298 RepID=A0ABS9SKE4_9BACT|nr:response regulator [Niabella ginsengisoli]MCH5598817.1 ATP-binding protein [Niabella ginsengisoli]